MADDEIGHVDHLLHFSVTLGFNLSDFQRHQRAQLILLLSQGLADQSNDLTSLRRWDHTPDLKRLKRFFHDALIVF